MAAHELIQKLDRDLLECGICLDRYNQPRALPCQHCFCHACLERYCQGQKQVLCPNCKNPTAVPEEGVSGFPAHFFMNTLQETLDMEKLKVCEAAAYPVCTNCNKPDKKAIVRCLDCKEFFCSPCHEHHDGLKAMQNHKIVTIEDLQTGDVVLPLTTSQDQMCTDHEGEIKKFYCETCMKPVCRDCIVMKQHCRDHDYVTLKEASKQQSAIIVQLVKEGEGLRKEYHDAIQETEAVERQQTMSLKYAEKRVDEIKNRHLRMVAGIYDKFKAELIDKNDKNSVKIKDLKQELQTHIAEVENTCHLATKVTKIGSDYDIATIYPTLSASLEELNAMTKPKPADEVLGYVGVEEVAKLVVPDVVGVMKAERWKQTGRFSIEAECAWPNGIAVHPDGDLALTIFYEGATVFSQTGVVKFTFQGPFHTNLRDIAITVDNRYVLGGDDEILFYNSQGKKMNYPKASTFDVNNQPANPESLAVDSRGRIIAGLKGDTISIHHADGKLISKFATPDGTPRWLDVTSTGDIAVTIDNKTLQLMDYYGNNVRVVKPPQGVTDWKPGSVCCSKQGEIFVVNHRDSKGVYRYTADGDQCLGCVITGLHNPTAIAITEDGQQLFVVECMQSVVKIFQRQ